MIDYDIWTRFPREEIIKCWYLTPKQGDQFTRSVITQEIKVQKLIQKLGADAELVSSAAQKVPIK